MDNLLFGKVKVIKRSLCLIWLIALTYVGLVSLAGCNKDFDYKTLALAFVCPKDSFFANLAMESRSYIVDTLPLVMLAIYLAIILRFQIITKGHGITLFKPKKRAAIGRPVNNSSPSSGEINFFVQSLIICVVLELEGLAYDHLHYLEFEGEFRVLPKLAQMWMTRKKYSSALVEKTALFSQDNTFQPFLEDNLLFNDTRSENL
uniref:Uncharacterized protein n=1 Tax=Ditylenchus dipsaci TaxID=166011 RepID=A0A915DZM5_9BILA